MSELDLLLSLPELHKQYSFTDYVLYCSRIRDSIWPNKPASKEQILFFEKQFIEEMEPLSKIIKHSLSKTLDTGYVKYTQHGQDPPDARIIWKDREIGVEFTTSKDVQLIKHAIDQTRQGNLTSFTGHSSKDIKGSKNRGYEDLGVEFEFFETETIPKLSRKITDALNNKLSKNNLKPVNWLCITIDDVTIDLNDLSFLDPIFIEYQNNLLEKNIEKLYFVGFKSLFREYTIQNQYTRLF